MPPSSLTLAATNGLRRLADQDPDAAHLAHVYLDTPRALVWRNASSDWKLLVLLLPMATRLSMLRNPIFSSLVRDWGLNVRFIGVDEYGRTPLHCAASDGRVEEVVRLLAASANPNAQDDHGWSPLHFAAQTVSPGAAEALLAAGAQTKLTDSFGNTALWRAVFES